MNRRGYLYTLAIIVLIMPLIAMLLFYTSSIQTSVEDTSSRVRCDELYYFVQDVEHNLERSLIVYGRRAAAYIADNISATRRTIEDYTYTNCTSYQFDGNASEAAIAELLTCGTFNGTPVPEMGEYTIPEWLSEMEADALERGFRLDVEMVVLKVLPYDAWDFATIVSTNVEVEDLAGMCNYRGFNSTAMAITSIIGLQDVLYPINTNGTLTKPIINCSPNIDLEDLAGCSNENLGEDIGSGNVVFYSDIDNEDLTEYCSVCDKEQDSTIIVFDTAVGNCNSFDPQCFNISSPCHFAGAIDYAKNDPNSFTYKCDITIPWIAATGKLDNETVYGLGWKRNESCADENISGGQCAIIKVIPSCGIYQVVLGYDSESLNTSCYLVSDISYNWPSCPGQEYPDGPSFFDRLEGRYSVSGFYANQSMEYFGNGHIGIETLVSPYQLNASGIEPNTGDSWIDYLYWQEVGGSSVTGICSGGEYPFKLDCPHAYVYGVDTTEVNAFSVKPISDITVPADTQLFEGCPSVQINGTADDCDGTVSSVDVRINGVWHGAEWGDPEWNYTLATATTNKYVLSSRAIDNNSVIGEASEDVIAFIVGCPSGDNGPPPAPALQWPTNGETGVDTTPIFLWDAPADASGIYRYQIQITNTKKGLVTDDYTFDIQYWQLSALENNQEHTWRVRAQDNAGNWGPWSAVWTFET